MKYFGIALLAVLATGSASSLYGQYGPVNGFGNVVFPALGHAPAGPVPFGNIVFPAAPGPGYNAFRSVTNTGFAGNLGGIVGGLHPYTGARRHSRSSGIFAYPAYVGGYVAGPSDQGAVDPSQPQAASSEQPPTVIDNYYYGTPPQEQGQGDDSNFHLYQQPTSEPVETPPSDSYYLFAFKDHTIYSAVAYYIEGDTLHYFTSGNVHNQASVSLVDTQTTERLNRQRGIDIRLPK